MGFEESKQIGYSLRENPKKKSWKFSTMTIDGVDASSSSSSSMEENQCKTCDKKFKSRKALFGHMRHHSERGKKRRVPCKECGKMYKSMKCLANHISIHKLVFDKDSTSARYNLAVKKKRSVRKRSNFYSNSSESFSVTIIDDEVHQAARCLMMLSQGTVTTFDDDFDHDDDDCFQIGKRDLDCVASEFLAVLYETKESVLDSALDNKVEEDFTETKLDESLIEEYGLIKKVEFFEACDDESLDGYFSNNVVDRVSGSDFKCVTCNKVFGSCRALAGHQKMHSTKAHVVEMSESEDDCGFVKVKCREDMIEVKKVNKHKCNVCLKDFASVQALGGHKRVHMAKNRRRRVEKKSLFFNDV